MAKAVRFNEKGSIESVLHLATIPIPKASPGTSVVKIRASAINPADCKNVEGSFPETTLPRTPGRDFAGVVVDGDKNDIGKEVWGTGGTTGYDRDGSHAQYIAIPTQGLQEKPANLSFVEASACGVAFLTASLMLERVKAQSGEHVLVLGSSGAVGSAVVQLARNLGAIPVPSGRSPHDDKTLNITQESFEPDLLKITSGKGISVVVDTVGDATLFQKSLLALNERGKYTFITAPKDPSHQFSFDAMELYRHDKSIHGVNSINVSFEDATALLGAMKEGFEKGVLVAPKGSAEVDMTDEKAVVEAYLRVKSGSKVKQVLVNNA